MKIVKFEGATMRDALAKVKSELGDQAVIVSTRQIKRGLLGGTACEISAAIEEEAEAGIPRFAQQREPSAPVVVAAAHEAKTAEEIDKVRSELRSLRALVRTANDGRATNELKAELAALRALVEQLAAAKAPVAAAAPTPTPIAPKKPAAKPMVASSTGRIVVLVGPTGAGKTTTIAKLAARAALIDQRSVAIVTLDHYRIGGVDQIRTFADLIGIPLQTATSAAALAEIAELDDSEVIYVDTAGRSPRDTAAIAELAAMIANLPDVEVHLTIPATSSPQMIDDLVARYAPLGPSRILFTKLDEVGPVPELLAASARASLPITYITTGQAVPEDIEEPNGSRIVELATKGLPMMAIREAA